MDYETEDETPPQPTGFRFTAFGTGLCLVLWLAVVSLESVLTALDDDPMAGFAHPVEVAVRAVETPVALGEAAVALVDDSPIPFGIDPSGGFEPDEELRSAAETYRTIADRLRALGAVAEADAGQEALDDFDAADRRAQAAELYQRAAVLAFEAGDEELDPWLPPELDDPASAALRTLLTGAGPVEREAFDDLDTSVATVVLDRRLAERAGDEEAAADAEERRASLGVARLTRLATLAGLAVPAGALGLLTLVLLAVRPLASTRMDRAGAPTDFPEPEAGLGLFARYAVGFLVVSIVAELLLAGLVDEGPSPLLGASVLVASAPLLILARRRYAHEPTGSLTAALGLGLDLGRAWRLVPIAAAGWLASIAGVLTISLGLGGLDLETNIYSNPFLDLIAGSDAETRARLLIEAALWAPLFEELAFRAALFGGLRRRLPFAVAAPLSAVLFALPHQYDPVGMLGIAWVGLVLAWVYERTRSLWAPIAVHFLFNFAQLQLSFALFA